MRAATMPTASAMGDLRLALSGVVIAVLVLMILASASALVHHVTGSSPSCTTITTGSTEWLSCD